MPVPRCSYVNCRKTSETMFRFPWRHPVRLKKWLTNCGNKKMKYLPPVYLRNRYVCHRHFRSYQIKIKGGPRMRSRLTLDAVPEPYQFFKPEEHCTLSGFPEPVVLRPLKVYSRRKPEPVVYKAKEVYLAGMPKPLEPPIDEIKMEPKSPIPEPSIDYQEPQSTTNPAPRNSKYSPEYKTLMLHYMKLRRKLKTMIKKRNILKKRKLVDLSTFKFKSPTSKLIAKMQFKKHKRFTPWTAEEREFCETLRNKSPPAYRFLFKSGVVLAAESTIRSWRHIKNNEAKVEPR